MPSPYSPTSPSVLPRLRHRLPPAAAATPGSKLWWRTRIHHNTPVRLPSLLVWIPHYCEAKRNYLQLCLHVCWCCPNSCLLLLEKSPPTFFFGLKSSFLPAICNKFQKKECNSKFLLIKISILPDLSMFFPLEIPLLLFFFDTSTATRPTLLARSSRAGAASASVSLSLASLRGESSAPKKPW